MADPPRQCLPASFQRHGADSDSRSEQEKVSGGSEARSSEFQSGSEFVSASESRDSDQSLSASELDDDDLLDTDEEYERELEEQRLADEKNGHFAEGRSSSPARGTVQSLPAPPPRVSLASHKARVSDKDMHLDEIATAGGGRG